jgi:tungstate transport system ATP-binding protein
MSTLNPLEYSSIKLSLGHRVLFKELCFEINRGECVLLSGDNGEGKTTLLRIMAGIKRPDSGMCRYHGVCHDWRRARAWLLQNVVYLHQDPYLFDASVEDNIAYGLRRRGLAKATVMAIVNDALQRAGLDHLQTRSGKQLSGGEKQRVALLRAWVLSPHLLLLDEPVASMDQQARQRTLFMIRWLLQEGVSLVITAHEPRLFAPLADRHLRLERGELANGAPIHQGLPSSTETILSSGLSRDDQYHQP